MRILDLFSWLPAKEISIEEIEKIFMDDMKGIPMVRTVLVTGFQMMQMLMYQIVSRNYWLKRRM